MKIIFLSKNDCHLCEEALPIVERVCAQENIALEVIKIVKGDAWWEKYWDKIPVVLVDGVMAFKYHVDEEKLIGKIRRYTQ